MAMNHHVGFVKCLNCGTELELHQPEDHSEYTPAGTCPVCGHVHFLSNYINSLEAKLVNGGVLDMKHAE